MQKSAPHVLKLNLKSVDGGKNMKAIIVGSGAGGGTAALELTLNGYEVTILEAGKPFKPFHTTSDSN